MCAVASSTLATSVCYHSFPAILLLGCVHLFDTVHCNSAVIDLL